jgi:hypothetical protein
MAAPKAQQRTRQQPEDARDAEANPQKARLAARGAYRRTSSGPPIRSSSFRIRLLSAGCET